MCKAHFCFNAYMLKARTTTCFSSSLPPPPRLRLTLCPSQPRPPNPHLVPPSLSPLLPSPYPCSFPLYRYVIHTNKANGNEWHGYKQFHKYIRISIYVIITYGRMYYLIQQYQYEYLAKCHLYDAISFVIPGVCHIVWRFSVWCRPLPVTPCRFSTPTRPTLSPGRK